MSQLVSFFCVSFAIASCAVSLHAQESKEPGSAKWAKEYPKVVKSGIEVQGSMTVNPGFKFVEIEFYATPFAGGEHVSVGKLKTQDGQWGDLKDGKLVAGHIDLEKGKWRVWAKARYTPEGKSRILEYYTMIETVEIK